MIIILLISFLSTFHKTIRNYETYACRNYDDFYRCREDIIHILSVANYGLKWDPVDAGVNSFFLIILYVLVAIIKHQLVKEDKIIGLETETVGDFSVMLTRLPKDTDEQHLWKTIEKDLKVKVEDICMCYDVDEYI